jgi:cation transport ATPase
LEKENEYHRLKVSVIDLGFNSVKLFNYYVNKDDSFEALDVVLMTEDLQKIPHMIRVSRQSVFTIQQNFYGTLSVDGLGFILAATGNLNPLFAAFIHIASELIFMVNSARLIIDRSGT